MEIEDLLSKLKDTKWDYPKCIDMNINVHIKGNTVITTTDSELNKFLNLEDNTCSGSFS